MNKKLWNWRLWVGFAVAVLALITFVAFIITVRNIWWLCVALFVVAGALLLSGLGRAYGQRESYRGKVAGPILTGASVLMVGLFSFVTHEIPKHFAAATNAPRVGQSAPQFTLVDSGKKPVSLASVLSSPMTPATGAERVPKAVLLVFYRGYW